MNQYYHQKHLFPRSTVSVEVPKPKQLNHLLQDPHDKLIMLQVGYALVHPDDRFIKKEGRKIADSKLTPQTFRLKSVTFDKLDNKIYVLEIIDETYRIKELTFKSFSSKNRLYFIGARVI